MNYEFVGDTEALEALHKTITEEAENVKSALDEIFSLYESLGGEGVWTGTNYDNFIAEVSAKHDEMYKSYDAFVKFAEQIETAKNGVSDLISEIGC